uniref:beta-ketoacyl synthase N-terminal-like domain-containing protein n=1 Tax=Chitinolyticbacter albus TaxID=2961951 RepID=UPI00210EFBAE
MSDNQLNSDFAVAVIGMAGRFPGAPDLDRFWEVLRDGRETIHAFSDEELRELGVSQRLLDDPRYVKAASVLEGFDQFDAEFFDFTASEARLLDPQRRMLLEVAWSALEHAGIDPATSTVPIGLYGSVGLNTYLIYNLLSNSALIRESGELPVLLSSDKDYAPTHVSYKLDLRGPSVSVQTACSSSLVSVHMARQALLTGECDVALAGGASLNATREIGYLYQPGSVLSSDGHVHPFDAQASGTVFGSGAGMVVLKRYADAVADGDTIHAVLIGSAINND